MSASLSKTDTIFEINYNQNFTPFPSPKVNVKNMNVDGKDLRVMKNHANGLCYTLDDLSYEVWLLIDGKHTVKEIKDELSKKWSNVTPKMVSDCLLSYAEEGLLQSQIEVKPRKRINIVSAFRIEIGVIRNSTKLITAIHKRIKSILITPLLWASVVFVLLGIFLFAGTFTSIFADRTNFEILGSTVVGFFFYYFVALAPVLALHEISHGLALVHYGGSPGEIGTGLLYFGPFFYIDAADSWTLKRRQRIIVYMAGNLATLLVGSSIVFVNLLWKFSPPISHFFSMTAFFCFYMTLWNIIPTFDSDGYYSLADSLNIPNLRHDSVDQIKHFVNKILRKPIKKMSKTVSTKKQVTLAAYAVVAAGFFAYLVYQTTTITMYMSGDVAAFAGDLWSMIIQARQFSGVLVLVGVLTIFYFAMSVMGYGIIFVATVRKAKVRNLQLEAVHDRDLSTFQYLPREVSESLVDSMMTRVQKTARQFTRKFKVKLQGSLCVSELRIGGTKWDVFQAKSHMGEMERVFRLSYQNFLKHHQHEIFNSIGIYSPEKAKLTSFLTELADQASSVGMPEAKKLVDELLGQECKTTLYLLNSVFGTVCTLELPPDLLKKYEKSMLPMFFARDLAVTDLYDEVEDFKKQVIYGFDSLSSLGFDTRKSIRESLAHPEKYQLTSLFEPVRGMLLFVGRTEEMEGHIGDFGSLFVCQAWYGYMDNILRETNFMLSSMGRLALLRKKQLPAMKNGELTLMRKNLSVFLEAQPFVNDFIKKSEEQLQYAVQNMLELEKHLKPTSPYKVGLINSILAINKENKENLPHEYKRLQKLYVEFCSRLQQVRDQVSSEQEKRKAPFLRKKRKMLIAYPFAMALSIILALTGLLWISSSEYLAVASLAGATLLQALYWMIYFLACKSFNNAGRYSSPEFDRVHLYILALTQAIHKFVANADILKPSETTIHDSNDSPQNEKTRQIVPK
jgi:hypothetical protein